jgi:hypothetical protein
MINARYSEDPCKIDKSIPRKDLQIITHNCKDGTKITETIDNSKYRKLVYQDPCRNNGGIIRKDYPIAGCGTPTMCKADEVFVNCRCQKK